MKGRPANEKAGLNALSGSVSPLHPSPLPHHSGCRLYLRPHTHQAWNNTHRNQKFPFPSFQKAFFLLSSPCWSSYRISFTAPPPNPSPAHHGLHNVTPTQATRAPSVRIYRIFRFCHIIWVPDNIWTARVLQEEKPFFTFTIKISPVSKTSSVPWALPVISIPFSTVQTDIMD